MEGEVKEETLPPGFRFHPTDEELITCYLINKISDATFTGRAITDVDLNKCEPWDLPGKAKMGEKEWYFFSLRDRKYPTGVRTNRATNTGYWKTTGKDKEIFNNLNSDLIGMKKTLVFYKGRAPRGEKSNWVMHEYRIHSKSAFRAPKDEWVVCRVLQKSPGGKSLKYSSNHHNSRGTINTYNLEIGPTSGGGIGMPIVQSHVMQQAVPVDAYQCHLGRDYINNAELAELTRVFRAGAGTTSIPMQSHQFNYPTVGGGGGFTISGLNLNLGAATVPPQFLQQPPTAEMSHHDVLGVGTEAMGYVGNLNTNKFMGGINHCANQDNYWPPYYY